MSELHYGETSIYEALNNIQNGRYVMPAFQRSFVWSMVQVEKLWDSILLDYPIANFLFWHLDEKNTTPDTYFCEFLRDVTFNSRKEADEIEYETDGIDISVTDTAILDGQQRLTSLYLSLIGSAGIRPKNSRKKKTGSRIMAKLLIELNENRIDIDEDEYNSKKFDIRFSDKIGKQSPTQFEISRVMEGGFRDKSTRDAEIERAIANVPPSSKQYAKDILIRLCKKIHDEKLIRYTEIVDMKQDDALEMFVRFNSAGKPLRKSEITMAILEVYWPSAKTEFGSILKGPYEDFGTDFIIRAALMIYGDVVKSTISKSIADELKNNWDAFKQSLENLSVVLSEERIDVGQFSSSWNVLLPIIYFIYYNPKYLDNVTAIRSYLVRAVLFTYFQSGTTAKLQQMKSNINDYDYELTTEMLDQMGELRVTDGRIEDILNAEKGSRIAGEALYFLSLGWRNKTYKYEQDHLHPFERFCESKPPAVSMEDWREWHGKCNRLPNLQLLEGRSNGSKSEMRLIDYYNDMNDQQKALFREEALIPDGVSLELSQFGEFYESRSKVLRERLLELMS